MIELTNAQIVTLNQSLSDLRKSNAVLNIKVSYKLSRIGKVISSFMNTIEQEQMKLYQKYGEQQDDSIKVGAENIEAFTKEYEDLMSVKNEVEINPIKLEEFGEVEIDFNTIQGLMGIIEE